MTQMHCHSFSTQAKKRQNQKQQLQKEVKNNTDIQNKDTDQ